MQGELGRELWGEWSARAIDLLGDRIDGVDDPIDMRPVSAE